MVYQNQINQDNFSIFTPEFTRRDANSQPSSRSPRSPHLKSHSRQRRSTRLEVMWSNVDDVSPVNARLLVLLKPVFSYCFGVAAPFIRLCTSKGKSIDRDRRILLSGHSFCKNSNVLVGSSVLGTRADRSGGIEATTR
jgi:hypothetical protein